MDALQWLTPAERRRPAFPRWVRWPAGLAFIVCVAASVQGSAGFRNGATALAFLSALPVGWWLEEAAYGSMGDRSTAAKLFAHLLLCPMAFMALLMAGCLGQLPYVGLFLGSFGSGAGWWVGSASFGTAVLVVIDAVVSRRGAKFRTRLTLAILWLVIGFAVPAAVLLAVMSRVASVVATTIEKNPSELRIEAGLGFTKEQIQQFLHDQPLATSLLVSFLLGGLAIPAVISMCSKLADAAMERLRPMMRAFALVSEGQRTVRVEEAGSTEFIELAKTFNRFVETLAESEKMERAFGRYVSGQVLSKIRSQHGEAELPPSLRDATVFFADIRGFTTLSERLSPEQVVSFLNRYLARVVARVDEHFGYLNKFIGDAVVVVFNGPVDQQDHAERAVRCALALQEEVARLNAEGALPEIGELRIGVGVATGQMVCGNVGGPTQMEYTVIGDTVNLSARLTSLAPPGEVWVSEATAKAATSMRFTALPEVKVKGKEKPVTPMRAER
jgi:class 3 adenylate cyclase